MDKGKKVIFSSVKLNTNFLEALMDYNDFINNVIEVFTITNIASKV